MAPEDGRVVENLEQDTHSYKKDEYFNIHVFKQT